MAQDAVVSIQARNGDVNDLCPKPFQPAMLKTYWAHLHILDTEMRRAGMNSVTYQTRRSAFRLSQCLIIMHNISLYSDPGTG